MKYSKPNIYVILAFSVLLFAGVIACEKKQPESSLESDAPESSISDSAPEDTKIADLLASLQMHHFKERIKAPEFELTSINGKKVSLSQYHGDVVLLSFWATW